MKYIFNVILFAILSGQLSGQVTIDNLIMPAAGDSVELFVDAAPSADVEITEPGGDEYWQWTLSNAIRQAVVFDTNDRTDLFPFADTRASSAGFVNYYDIRPDGWLLSGQVGEDPFGLGLNVNLFYQPAFREYYAPVAYEDSTMQTFDLYTGIPLSLLPDSILSELPLVPDSMRARIATQVVDKVDAWGTLSINDGEEETLRIRQERRIAIRVEAKISILPWTDVTDLLVDFLDFLPFEINLNDTIVGYQFLAQGYTLPLAQVTLDSMGMAGSVTYQQPVVSSVNDLRNIASFKIYPNPAGDFVTVDLLEETMFINVYDLQGRLVSSANCAGDSQVELEVSDFAPGMFLLTTWNSKGTLTGMQKLSVSR